MLHVGGGERRREARGGRRREEEGGERLEEGARDGDGGRGQSKNVLSVISPLFSWVIVLNLCVVDFFWGGMCFRCAVYAFVFEVRHRRKMFRHFLGSFAVLVGDFVYNILPDRCDGF